MKPRTLKRVIPSILLLFFSTSISYSQQLAFLGAEGYGKHSVSGRGGSVYEVTPWIPSGRAAFRRIARPRGHVS